MNPSERAKVGRPPLQGGRATASFVLRMEQLDWIEAEAQRRKCSKSEALRAILDAYWLRNSGFMDRLSRGISGNPDKGFGGVVDA